MACLNSFGLVLILSMLGASCNAHGVADTECPASGLSYLPFYSDCTLFYQCNEGKRTLMQCPEGFAWSIVINACREKSLVDCSYTTIAPPDNNSSGLCPDNGLTYLPHYGDCTKYFQCFMGSESLMTCQDGYAWSITLAACDLKQNVDCSYTTLSPPTSPTPVTKTTPKPYPDFKCPQSSGISFHPHPYDCSMFFECISGTKHTLQCPMGFFFSITLVRCELQSYVDCSYTSVSPIVTTPTTPATTPTTTRPAPTQIPGNRCEGLANGTFLKHPTDCSKFIECTYGAEIEFSCPAYTTWNQEILTCDSNPNNCK